MVDLPASALPAPPLTPKEGRRAWLDSLFVDHGLIRYVYFNKHRVSQSLWRSAQPTPWHLRRAKTDGIRTVLNLRGRRDTCGSYILERRACQQLGLRLVDFPIRSRSALEPDTLRAAAELFGELEYPTLLHCKSGADRAGLMATLYLFLHEQVPLAQALDQLSLRYGHIRQAKTGVIDHVFETFLAETDGSQRSFLTWLDNGYDPVRLTEEFRAGTLANFLVNAVLRRE